MFPNLFIELKRSKSTQQQLAERIGISHSSLQNKLQGRTQFTLKEMRDIQAVFADCSLDYLFFRVRQQAQSTIVSFFCHHVIEKNIMILAICQTF